MQFALDSTAMGILFSSLLLIFLFRKVLFPYSPKPSLAFSRLADLKSSSWRLRLAALPPRFHLITLICLMIAFVDPHFLIPKTSVSSTQKQSLQEASTEGLAIYLVLDQSGSMAESVETTGENAKKVLIPKIDLLKSVTQQFILNHPSDLIGLVSFARVPRVLVPLTLDQATLLKQLKQIRVIKKSDNDGTAIGYAIYKTAHLLTATRYFADSQQKERSSYTIKSAIIIIVTDGFQDPSHLDQGNRLRTMELDDAAAYAKSQNIRVYVINIDPALSTLEYAPQRRQLQAITSLTGGHFYLVNDTQELQDIYAAIDQLEKGQISQIANTQANPKQAYIRFSLYPFFILFGLGCLLIIFLLELCLLRTIP